MTQEQVKRGYLYWKRIECKRTLVMDDDFVSSKRIKPKDKVIHFFGFKKIEDERYKCEDCFRREIKREDIDSFITYGETPYIKFLKAGNKKSDLSNFCVECLTKLYIIRHKDIVDLHFE